MKEDQPYSIRLYSFSFLFDCEKWIMLVSVNWRFGNLVLFRYFLSYQIKPYVYFLSYFICWKVAYYRKLEGEIWFKDVNM